MQVRLKKGRETLQIAIADDKIQGVLSGSAAAPIPAETIDAVIEEGLHRHCPDDIAARKMAVIIPDDTRLWARGDRYVPTIVKTLQKLGADSQNMVIVIALGTHADVAEERFPELAGAYCCRTAPVINSANRNRARLDFIGRTSRGTDVLLTREVAEAEHIVIFGGVLHHMIAGFGGGRKYLFPGVAGYDSIQQNHSLALDETGLPHPLVRQACLEGNPVNEDIEEACDMVLQDRGCTYVSVAVNGEGEIFHARAGELRDTFMTSCRKLNEVCTAPIDRKGDFVICSAGGHRTDGQLYQASKALFNGAEALKHDGCLLLVAECTDGHGNARFADMLKRHRNDPAALGNKLLTGFDMPSYIALRVIDLLRRYRIGLCSGFSQEETEEMGFSYVQDVSSYVKKLDGTGYIIPFAENILPVSAS